jgi:hypothetical protein
LKDITQTSSRSITQISTAIRTLLQVEVQPKAAERYQLLLYCSVLAHKHHSSFNLSTMSRHHQDQDMPYVIDTQEVSIVDDTDPPTHYDAFLYYSDDEVRMRTLSGGILGSTREEPAMSNGGGTTIRRKTRLSFELHPSVFLDDLFSDDDVAENINNLKGHNPQLAALIATLFGVDDADLFAVMLILQTTSMCRRCH